MSDADELLVLRLCSTLSSFIRWLVQGQMQKHVCFLMFSYVEGEVVLKSSRGRFKRRYTGFTSSHLTEVESVQRGGQKQSSGSKKANGCAGNHVEKGIKCSQTLMSTGPDS